MIRKWILNLALYATSLFASAKEKRRSKRLVDDALRLAAEMISKGKDRMVIQVEDDLFAIAWSSGSRLPPVLEDAVHVTSVICRVECDSHDWPIHGMTVRCSEQCAGRIDRFWNGTVTLADAPEGIA